MHWQIWHGIRCCSMKYGCGVEDRTWECLKAEPQIKLELIECLDLWRCNCLDTCVRSMADQYLYNINWSQPASHLRLSEAQMIWNKTLLDVALWADNWRLPRAKQDLVGKENLNTSAVLDDFPGSAVGTADVFIACIPASWWGLFFFSP